jgi:pimeloyl-ACP methyl ester carboxylesterase
MRSTQFIHFLPAQDSQSQAPLIVYLPGMDGTGKLFDRQAAALAKSFDVRRLSIPVNDLTDWEPTIDRIVELIGAELGTDLPKRSVYVCGESFGGCLAMKLAIQVPELCDRLILINPASSFQQRLWMRWSVSLTALIPPNLYQAGCIALLPFLAAVERIDRADLQDLLRAMQSIEFPTAMWRISLLDRFNVTLEQLQQISQPTLVISSGSDRLLPSQAEGKLLTRWIANARLHFIPQGGHAVLLERDVNLHEILCKNGFLPTF